MILRDVAAVVANPTSGGTPSCLPIRCCGIPPRSAPLWFPSEWAPYLSGGFTRVPFYMPPARSLAVHDGSPYPTPPRLIRHLYPIVYRAPYPIA